MELARWFRLVSVADDAAQLTGAGGEGARLEEARRPEPFVDTNARARIGHRSIFVQARRIPGEKNARARNSG
jgi:hypothetical protein